MLRRRNICSLTPQGSDIFMKIYTITLNPAYDVHAYTEHFEPFHENLARVVSRDAGGKGVNISRALCAVECDNVAVIVMGKDNCADFKADVDAAGAFVGLDDNALMPPEVIYEGLFAAGGSQNDLPLEQIRDQLVEGILELGVEDLVDLSIQALLMVFEEKVFAVAVPVIVQLIGQIFLNFGVISQFAVDHVTQNGKAGALGPVHLRSGLPKKRYPILYLFQKLHNHSPDQIIV